MLEYRKFNSNDKKLRVRMGVADNVRIFKMKTGLDC